MIAIAIALYFLAFFIVVIVKDVRIRVKTRIDVNTKYFDISAIVDTNKHCITEDYTTFYDEAFVCYDCIIDSVYQFSITKVGSLANKDNLGLYKTSNSFIKSKHSRRMCSTVTPVNYSPSFDSGVIPLNKIDSLEIFVNGHINKTVVKKTNLVAYSLNIGSVVFSFNDHNNMDLYYIDVHSPNSNSFLFFYLDKNSLLYIGLCNLPLSMWQ